MNVLCRRLLSARTLVCQQAAMSSTARSKPPTLDGKVAVVTASTDGIGFEIARRLGEDGAHVVISSRKEANVKKALKELQGLSVSGIVCHVSKENDRKALFEHAVGWKGGIDILVSNAAVNPFFGSMLETPESMWDKIFETNVKSTFLLTREVVPYMEKRGGGSIVYVSSIGGFQPFELLGAYSVSKTALLGLTKAIAPQCAQSNIRVNCIAPGIVETKFSEAMWKDEANKEHALKMIPLKRIAKPREMGGIVSFLCSEDASYITGENFVIAGGMLSRL